MTSQIVGSIQMFSFGRIPKGFMLCDGRALSVSQYPHLFQVIDYTYGGDYADIFNIPNIQGRIIIGPGQGGHYVSQTGGAETTTLVPANLPTHSHDVVSAVMPISGGSDTNTPVGNFLGVADSKAKNIYADAPSTDTGGNTIMGVLNGSTDICAGGTPINIQNQFLTIGYYICLEGIII